jgi:hypothetical protein
METRNTFFRLIEFAIFLGWACVAYGETAPCDLLTQNQVNTILEAKFGTGAPIATTGCSWSAAGPPRIVVSVSMQSEKMFTAAKSPGLAQTTKTSIPGLGDEAVFVGTENFSSLWLRKGTKFPLIRIYGLPVSAAQTKLKALATDVLSKL